jgi:hypothetical protein
MRLISIAGVAAILAGFGLASQAAADIASIEGPIPVGPSSVIYGSSEASGAAFSVPLAPHGYVEEEYFVSGTADAYRHADGGVEPLLTDLPYTTRIVVRRPADHDRFSGVVHFEAFHPTGGVTFTWPTLSRYLMARGDIYIAVGLGDANKGWSGSPRRPDSQHPIGQHEVTTWFDPVRYEALHWPEEEGVRFDVMGQVGRKLRSDDVDNPLRGLDIRAMLVSGWSYTGSLQRTFINEGFHDRARLADGRPVFDGYLIGVSSQWNEPGYLPLHNDEPYVPVGDPRRDLKPIDAKVIQFLTESEIELNLNRAPEAPDSDAAIGGRRVYELGGVIHVASLVDPTRNYTELPNLAQLARRGYDERLLPSDPVFCCPLPQSDAPMGAFVRASMENLRLWVLDGETPPRAEPLAWDGDKLARDDVGNVVGGVRPAEFEAPIARYGRYAGDALPACRADAPYPAVFFVRNDLSQGELIDRYGSAEGYVEAYDREIDRLVEQRWLLPEDGLRLKANAREQAMALFRLRR